jgi:hypothetical protein
MTSRGVGKLTGAGGGVAELTQAQRDALPASAFAIPERRAYPYRNLPGGPEANREHAANALARVSHYGTAEEKARVRAAVAAEYPGMRAGEHGGSVVVADRSRRRRGGVKVYRKEGD